MNNPNSASARPASCPDVIPNVTNATHIETAPTTVTSHNKPCQLSRPVEHSSTSTHSLSTIPGNNGSEDKDLITFSVEDIISFVGNFLQEGSSDQEGFENGVDFIPCPERVYQNELDSPLEETPLPVTDPYLTSLTPIEEDAKEDTRLETSVPNLTFNSDFEYVMDNCIGDVGEVHSDDLAISIFNGEFGTSSDDSLSCVGTEPRIPDVGEVKLKLEPRLVSKPNNYPFGRGSHRKLLKISSKRPSCMHQRISTTEIRFPLDLVKRPGETNPDSDLRNDNSEGRVPSKITKTEMESSCARPDGTPVSPEKIPQTTSHIRQQGLSSGRTSRWRRNFRKYGNLKTRIIPKID